MKKLASILFLLSVVMIISSCATTHPNQNMLVGTWVAQKVSPADPNIKIDPNVKPVLKQDASKDTTNMIAGRKGRKGNEKTAEDIEFHRQQQFIQLLRLEERSKLKLNSDKTAQKITGNKTTDFKWKMKKDGKTLIIKSKKHGRIKCDIERLTDSSAIVVEHFPIGDLKVKYVKK